MTAFAQVTSSGSATCRQTIQSCRPPMLWTISESTLTQNWLWSVRLANFAMFAISTCVIYARCVDRFRKNVYARWFMPSTQIELITAMASCTDLIRIFSTGFSPCWIRPLAWFWTLQSLAESRLPSVMSYTGYQSENASSSKLFFWCDIAWSAAALHQSTWWNCVVLSFQPPVDKASGLLPEATSSFLVSDSKHLVFELLLSRPSALELTPIEH